MASRKKNCEDCCVMTVVINPENCLLINRKQAEYLTTGVKISFENALNKLLTEFRELKTDKI